MDFEELYIKVRQQEGFLYEDSIVRKLPILPKNHIHYGLWKKRSKNCNRLLAYLHRRLQMNHILDLGCGNGWFSSKISEIRDLHVQGWDINRIELEQAARLFQKENLEFKFLDIFSQEDGNHFDVIILNACIQYFQNLTELISRLQKILNPKGEIHILDSPIYRRDEIENARKRSADYYRQIQYPDLINYYYHHSWDDLKPYSYKILYNPGSFIPKILNSTISVDSPFAWVVIR